MKHILKLYMNQKIIMKEDRKEIPIFFCHNIKQLPKKNFSKHSEIQNNLSVNGKIYEIKSC